MSDKGSEFHEAKVQVAGYYRGYSAELVKARGEYTINLYYQNPDDLKSGKTVVATAYLHLEQGKLSPEVYDELMNSIAKSYIDTIKTNLAQPARQSERAQALISGQEDNGIVDNVLPIGVTEKDKQHFFAIADIRADIPSDYPGYKPSVAAEILSTLRRGGMEISNFYQLSWGTVALADKLAFMAGKQSLDGIFADVKLLKSMISFPGTPGQRNTAPEKDAPGF